MQGEIKRKTQKGGKVIGKAKGENEKGKRKGPVASQENCQGFLMKHPLPGVLSSIWGYPP